MTRRTLSPLLLLLIAPLYCHAEEAKWQTVARHDGDRNPVTEGWRFRADRTDVRAGRETIGGKRWTYWKVADRGGGDGEYSFSLTRQQVTGPWRITLVARLVHTSAKGTGFGVVVQDGYNYWRLDLNQDGAYYDDYGRLAVRFGKPFDTTNAYHRYELLIEPVASCDVGAADRVTLLIDGIVHAQLKRRRFRHFRAAPGVSFGSTNSVATGAVHYHLVEFASKQSRPAPETTVKSEPYRTVRKTPDGHWHIGNSKQLFIDRRFIETSQHVVLRVNPPIKRPGAVLKSNKPWDAFRLIYFSMAKDGDRYKMWYQAFDDDQWSRGVSRSCHVAVT